MAVRYRDVEIDRLVRERKPLPEDFLARMTLREKRGHKERELAIQGVSGTDYRLILRLSSYNALDFSIILAVVSPFSNQLFRLRRYNGKHGEHSNPIEGTRFYGFHIHHATERYQEGGWREDTYAEVTDRFADFHSALGCLLEDCGFEDVWGDLFGKFGP